MRIIKEYIKYKESFRKSLDTLLDILDSYDENYTYSLIPDPNSLYYIVLEKDTSNRLSKLEHDILNFLISNNLYKSDDIENFFKSKEKRKQLLSFIEGQEILKRIEYLTDLELYLVFCIEGKIFLYYRTK